MPGLFPSQSAGAPLRAPPKSRDSSPSSMSAQTLGQPGTPANPSLAAGKWSNMGPPSLPSGKWAQATPQYQPTLVAPPWEIPPAQNSAASPDLKQASQLPTPPGQTAHLANGSPAGNHRHQFMQPHDPFRTSPAFPRSTPSPTHAGPHSSHQPADPFSTQSNPAHADPFAFGPLGAHMSTVSSTAPGVGNPSMRPQLGLRPGNPGQVLQPAAQVSASTHVPSVPAQMGGGAAAMQSPAGSSNPFGDDLFGQYSRSATSSPKAGSSPASPTASANPFGGPHPGMGIGQPGTAGAQSAAASSVISNIQQQQQQLLQKHQQPQHQQQQQQQQQGVVRSGLDLRDPFAHSAHLPPAAVPGLSPPASPAASLQHSLPGVLRPGAPVGPQGFAEWWAC